MDNKLKYIYKKCRSKTSEPRRSYSEFLPKYIRGCAIVFSLLAKAIAIFLHEYTYTVHGLFCIQTKRATVRQQDMFAARGDIAQFRHREVRSRD